MVSKCNACGKFASADSVKCSQCTSTYHRQCANFNADSRLPARWQCKSCKGKSKQKNGTPQSSGSDGADSDLTDKNLDNVSGSEELNLTQEIKLIRAQLTTIVHETTSCRQEMASFKQEIVKLNSTIADFNKRLNTVEEKVNNINNRLADVESKVVSFSSTDLSAKIESHLNDRDQEGYLCDLEIAGIEEVAGENPTHIVTLAAKKLGVILDVRDIVCAERRGKVRDVRGGNGAGLHPRVLVARLSRKTQRDEVIRAARTRRGADTSGIVSTQPPRRFYINERLTWYNRRLFHSAREEGRKQGFQYVWTRDGRTYIRRDKESPSYRIRTESDIDKVFHKK